jgi:DNA-directed RNA polymerase specialized sigma24 family protein
MKDILSIPVVMNDEKKNISQTVAEFSNRLFAFIKKRVASTEDAEDILQDVFYQLAGNTKPIEQLSSWLFTVEGNKITDSYRKVLIFKTNIRYKKHISDVGYYLASNRE